MGSFRSELSKIMTQNKWQQYPIGMYQGSQKLHDSDIKLMLKDPKKADEFGKALNSALIMAVSDPNWTTLWPKWIENEIQSVYIKNLKKHVSDTKLIIKNPQKCRWSWKIIKFCSHNGSFRSELSKRMFQKDWKQDPISINQGMYQGSEKYLLQDSKLTLKNAKKCRWSWKIIKFCSHNRVCSWKIMQMAVPDLNWAK